MLWLAANAAMHDHVVSQSPHSTNVRRAPCNLTPVHILIFLFLYGKATSQVASYVVKFEVAGNPASKMVGGQWKPHELSSSDREVQVLKCISWGDREEGRVDILPVILRCIARQAGHEISTKEAMARLSDQWLQKILTTGWECG